jgi:Hsp70 protein
VSRLLTTHLPSITVQQVLDDAGISKDEVDEIVLVGGSTRIPKVRTALAPLAIKCTQHIWALFSHQHSLTLSRRDA